MKHTNRLINSYILILSCYYFTIAKALCPSTELLYPCRCEQQFDILCGGDANVNLSRIFQSISTDLEDENYKHFKLFYLNNAAIAELTDKLFGDITFQSIIIENAHNLTVISRAAFASSNPYIISFRMWNSGTPNDTNRPLYNIFDVINGMVNIESVNIIDRSISSIPSNAFGRLSRLKHLQIYGSIKSIGSNAFANLNSIELIMLDQNPIEVIDDTAFNLHDKGNDNLLHLSLNSISTLTSDSFSSHTFAYIRRPFVLFLRTNPSLKFLDENVFATVVSSGNKINLWGTQLECDCRMYWLYRNSSHYRTLLLDERCSDGDSLFANREVYSQCH